MIKLFNLIIGGALGTVQGGAGVCGQVGEGAHGLGCARC